MFSYGSCLFFGLTGLFISCSLHSATVECPLKIATTQHLAAEHAGWKPFANDAVHFIEGVSFYSGAPDEQAMLKPDSTANGMSIWTFSSGDSIHIVCDYNQTIIRLSKALPANIASCQVSYDKSVLGAKGPVPTKIVCH